MKEQKMTPWEFKEYIEARSPSKYLLESDEQGWIDPFGVAPSFSLLFSRLVVSLNPHQILLLDKKNGENMLRLGNVDYMVVGHGRGDAEQIDVCCRTPLKGVLPANRIYRILAS